MIQFRRKINSNIAYVISFLFLLSQTIFGEGFVAGTLISASHGYIPIEELQVNHSVISYSFTHAKLVTNKIVQIKKNISSKIIQLTIQGKIIEVDPDQKFYCPLIENSWIAAKDLQKNHFILLGISHLVRIEKIV